MIYYILVVVTVVLFILSEAFKKDKYLRPLFKGIGGTILICILAIYIGSALCCMNSYCPMASISAAADLSASLASAPPRQDSTTPVSTSSICAHVVTMGLA